MPVWTFAPPPPAFRSATGGIGAVATLPVRVESSLGNDYYTGLKNETQAIRTVRSGEIFESNAGDVVRVLTTVYTPNGEITLTVAQQDKGLEQQQVFETVGVEEPAEAPTPAAPTGPIKLSIQEYQALTLEERASGKYTAVSSGVDAEAVEAANNAANANTPYIESQAPAGYYEPSYTAPQQQTYTDPYVGTQQTESSAPVAASGTGSGPDPANPYGGGQTYGPDITSSGNEGYWL